MRMDEIGEGIVKLRKRAGLSQEALGAALGVTRQAVSKWESGAALPSVDNIVELARVLGVSVDELLTLRRETTEDVSAAGVGRMFDAYAARQEKRARRLIVALSLAGALLLMLVALSMYLDARRSRDEAARLDSVENRIAQITSGIGGQIASAVGGALDEGNRILTDGGCREMSYDDETNELVLRAFAYPRETRAGETATFVASCAGGGSYTATAEDAGNGLYEAELRVPASESLDTVTLYVNLRADGATRSERVDTLYDPVSNLRMRISDLYANWTSGGDTITLTPVIEIHPAYDLYDNPVSWPVSGAVRAYRGNELLGESALTSALDDQADAYNEGRVEWLTMQSDTMTIEGVGSERIRIEAVVADNLGHEYTRTYDIVP